MTSEVFRSKFTPATTGRWTIVRSYRSTRFLAIAAWCAIVLGCAFRVVQLPSRTLFVDEAITQIRVAGHTGAELFQTLYDGTPRTVREFRAAIGVDAKSSASRAIASLAQEDTQHPPLFYVAELAMIRTFGDSLFAWRLLPALFGLLAIPAAYALGRELFASRTSGLIAAALFAISPIERIYSQQAREYSLLTLLTLLATLAIVRAVRERGVGAWVIYAALLTAGLYASPFMAYVLAGHAVFAGAAAYRSRSNIFLRFAGSSAIALAAFSPWLVQLAIHRKDIVEANVWSGTAWPLSLLVTKWVFNMGATFFDLEYVNLRWTVVLAVVSVVAIIAAIRGFRDADERARWCLGAAIAVPALLLVVPDLLLGEHRSSVARYALPVLAILPIIVARGLVGRPLSATLIFAIGLAAGGIALVHPTWWDNDTNADDARIAAAINSAPRPQIVSTLSPVNFVSFARTLDSGTRVSLSPSLAGTRFSPGEALFVLRPARADLAALTMRTGLRFVPIALGRSVTAHDVAARAANAGGTTMAPPDLYVSSTAAATSSGTAEATTLSP